LFNGTHYKFLIFYHFLSSILYEEKFNNKETDKSNVVLKAIEIIKKEISEVLKIFFLIIRKPAEKIVFIPLLPFGMLWQHFPKTSTLSFSQRLSIRCKPIGVRFNQLIM